MNGKTAYDTYPAWLKFHIGINRYELYPRRDPLMPTLLQDLATMKIVSSAEAHHDILKLRAGPLQTHEAEQEPRDPR